MNFVEFPHRCIVTDVLIDTSIPPSQRVLTGTTILDTKCDIQVSGKPTDSNYAIDADYIVYVPADTEIPRIQKGTKIELYYSDTDIRTGIIRQYEPGMMLGNRFWVKEISN